MKNDGSAILPYTSIGKSLRKWALISVGIAASTWITVFGGAWLFSWLTRDIRNRPTDLDYIPLQLMMGFALLIGPPIGTVCGLVSLRKEANGRWLSAFGVSLNLAVWIVVWRRRIG